MGCRRSREIDQRASDAGEAAADQNRTPVQRESAVRNPNLQLLASWGAGRPPHRVAADHPVRQLTTTCKLGSRARGSSPPARGRQHVRERNPAGLGFIPASVGPTPRTVTPKRVLRVHPRARGADRRTSAQFGFIPRAGCSSPGSICLTACYLCRPRPHCQPILPAKCVGGSVPCRNVEGAARLVP